VRRAFYGRLAELGYREGHTVEILRYFHGGVPARAAAAAGELVPLKPDVIIAVSPPSAFAVNKLTTTIPIVFYGVGQPVEVGLVTNLARPGANITGISFDVSPEFNAKQLQLLRDLLQTRQALRLAVLWDPERWTDMYVQATERAANAMGMKLQFTPVREAAELETAVSEAARQGNHGLVVLADVMFFLQRQRLAALAATASPPGDLRVSGGCRRRWIDVLRREPTMGRSSRRRLRRQDPQGRETR
jgi:putative tryptophan/tyrosine transport system substrate-binding protein